MPAGSRSHSRRARRRCRKSSRLRVPSRSVSDRPLFHPALSVHTPGKRRSGPFRRTCRHEPLPARGVHHQPGRAVRIPSERASVPSPGASSLPLKHRSSRGDGGRLQRIAALSHGGTGVRCHPRFGIPEARFLCSRVGSGRPARSRRPRVRDRGARFPIVRNRRGRAGVCLSLRSRRWDRSPSRPGNTKQEGL